MIKEWSIFRVYLDELIKGQTFLVNFIVFVSVKFRFQGHLSKGQGCSLVCHGTYYNSSDN